MCVKKIIITIIHTSTNIHPNTAIHTLYILNSYTKVYFYNMNKKNEKILFIFYFLKQTKIEKKNNKKTLIPKLPANIKYI